MFYEEVKRLLSLMFNPLPYFTVTEDPVTHKAVVRMPEYAWAIAGARSVSILTR
jgi:hypothetical protein